MRGECNEGVTCQEVNEKEFVAIIKCSEGRKQTHHDMTLIGITKEGSNVVIVIR